MECQIQREASVSVVFSKYLSVWPVVGSKVNVFSALKTR